jgi:small nuclear ribonucleoprotein (snRNP)-like protein
MFKKAFVLGLYVAFLNLCFSMAAFAQASQNDDAKHAAKVKANIQKRGTGKDARVQVELKDGTKLKGHVSQVNDDRFVVTNDATGSSTEVLYSETRQVKRRHRNTVWTVIGVGTLGAMIAIIVVAGKSD